MLIEFSVGNYLSIKGKQTLRMDASSITEYQDRLIEAGRYKLLRSAVIYGANASGKSNVLKAMATMRQIITTSAAQSSTATIPVEPFLLSTETEHSASYFEMLFIIDEVRYRYGFEADQARIHAEWLFESKKQQEKVLFVRERDSIEVNKAFKEGKGLEDRTSTNKLFLAVCDQFNGDISHEVILWINNLEVASGISHENSKRETAVLMSSNKFRIDAMLFVNKLNLGFEDIKYVAKEELFDSVKTLDELDEKIRSGIKTFHKKYSLQGKKIDTVLFELTKNESSGTNKIFDLLSPIFSTLMLGYTLIIDELDAKLHPLLTKEIINLFNSPETNSRKAQLIFATHDTNLLTYGQFRRDQIYFTEKDEYGATSLYSLVDYKEEDGSTVRKDRSFEKDYIQGRYGAIPYIGDFSKLFS